VGEEASSKYFFDILNFDLKYNRGMDMFEVPQRVRNLIFRLNL
jgi:hypothetical protein